VSISAEQRRLAAIMFTDMVGYTALSQRNEALALELLEEHRRILRSIFPRFNGTEIKTIGDAFLVEFQSALEAAQCALEIQRTLAKRNPDVSADRRIELRIGIHVGDVVHREGDVYGDGVNVASRIQPVAGIGGICISVDVERQIHHALDARFEKLAPIELKNVEVPMDLFRIVLPWETRALPSKSEIPATAGKLHPESETRIRRVLATSLVIVLLLAGLLGYQLWRTRNQPAPRENASPARTEAATGAIAEKSIAVLPFENLSEEKANEFFADGVQDQILTALAKIADLKVISRTSVMQYKTGVTRNLREIAQQLGVTHVLEGSVQRAGGKVRVNTQLINARTDAHEWAENYDRPVDDIFAIQTEIAKAIADQLQARLSPNEKKAIEQAPTNDVTAFDLYSRAKTLILTTSFSAMGAPNLLQAVGLLNQALARDPSFFLAQCELANAHDQLYFLGYDHTPARLALAAAGIEAALRLRPEAGEAHLARAQHLYRGYLDYNGALAELEIARRTLPNDPRIVELTGYILRRRGQSEEGLRNLERAVELDPRNYFTLQQIALSYLSLRRYSDEASVLDRALSIKDDVETKVTRGQAEFDWKADTRLLHQTLDDIRAKNADAIKKVADNWLICALAERDVASAEAALVALGDNPFGDDAVRLYRDFGEGLIGRMTKDEATARSAFTAARAEQEKRVQSQPDYGPAWCILGLIDAGLGRKEEALREGRRAIELMPVEKDALNGAHMVEYFTIIAAWVGEKDLAFEQLQKAAALHGFVTSGRLKLLPYWDPLRGDPRFEKIVESLAPKEN
jgi:adenylate cyclase